jgi:hypothetical protein
MPGTLLRRPGTTTGRAPGSHGPGPGRSAGLLIVVLVALAYQAVSTPLVEIPVASRASSADLRADVPATGRLRDDITSLGYHAVEPGGLDAAAVIGGDDGSDVQAARAFGVDHVVRLDGADARPRLERSDARFDTIRIALTDTAAAASSGTHALEATPLFTIEAWHLLLDRLQPGGMLSVSYWYRIGDHGSPWVVRATALAGQVLYERGAAHPRAHVLLYEGPADPDGNTLATLLVSPEPVSVATVARVADVAGQLGFTPLLTPREAADEQFVPLTSGRGPGDAVNAYGADVSPPTDDRPYFFQMADIGRAVQAGRPAPDPADTPMRRLLAAVLVLVAIVVVGGVLLQRAGAGGNRQRVPGPGPDHAAGRSIRSHVVYLSGAGVGLALVVHALVERLGIFLGRPSVALGLALGALLLVGAAGGPLARWLVDRVSPDMLVAPAIAASVLAVGVAVMLPRVTMGAAGVTTPARVAAVVALLAPLALVVGTSLPLGLATAAATPGVPVARLWALAAATTVVGWVAAWAVAITLGLAATLIIGGVVYAVAACGMWWAVLGMPNAHVLQGSQEYYVMGRAPFDSKV